MIRTLCFIALSASVAQADSLCGVEDFDRVQTVLTGTWVQSGASSIETETLSVVQPIDEAAAVEVRADGGLIWATTDQWLGGALSLEPRSVPYDVDAVDDLLTTTDSDWIADAVGDTPCGPGDLPQLSGAFRVASDAQQDAITGTVTLVPYFSDRVVLLAQIELRGEWGLGFLTTAALLTPDGPHDD